MAEFWPNVYPGNYMITSGEGRSKFPLVAFDAALIDARISNYNLLKISSILPARAGKRDFIALPEGSALLTAYATISSNSIDEIVGTAVAVGVPKDRDRVGVIMELSSRMFYNCDLYPDRSVYVEAFKSALVRQIKRMTVEAMSNHKIDYDRIECSARAGIVTEKKTLSLISAVCLW